mgnify:CR=1 FL=1
MLHGPVVAAPPGADPESALDAAAEPGRPGAGLDASAAKIETRLRAARRASTASGCAAASFPVPEAELPEALRGRPGIGLFGWRGGSALWSAAGPRSATAALARAYH